MKLRSLFVLILTGSGALLTAEPGPEALRGSGEMFNTSYYSSRFNGRRTAGGQLFSNNGLTAAHRSLPFGTKLKLTNAANKRSTTVTVTDRGPFVKGRDLSVTRHAASQLGFVRAGTAQLQAEVLSK